VKRYDFHPIQRHLYTYDILELPRPLKRFVKLPRVIVQPESDDEVLKILKVAEKFRIPVVPRGAATSAYGGVIPLQSCIVVDFRRMNKFKVDKGKKTVIAESGAIWWDIENELEKYGMALRIYPTSAPSSTVGGWIAQSGYGVGSLKYGSIAENIEWLEVADFGGVKRISGDDLDYYVGLCGTTGLILRACVKCRERSNVECAAVEAEIEDVKNYLEPQLYHATYLSSRFLEYSGMDGKDTLLLCYDSEPKTEIEGDFERGRSIWKNRFQQLRARKKGEIILSEVLLPYETYGEFYRTVERLNAAIEIQFSRDYAIFFVIFLADTGVEYYRTLLRALKVIKIAEKLGGRVYGTGMLFPHKSGEVYSEYGKIVEFKRKVDPNDLLNPGKALQQNSISRIIKIVERLIK
jgi:FAD/FMN-containing dehydrogenase